MRSNKYLLLVSSLVALLLLLVAAVQENFLREWRRVQATAHAEEGRVSVQLRQIVNPALRASDRCVSCHLGMAPTEQVLGGTGVLGPHKPVVHDPADFGCTVCHSGQGQATDKADAHGWVHFWPEPMIDPRFSYPAAAPATRPWACPTRPGSRRRPAPSSAWIAWPVIGWTGAAAPCVPTAAAWRGRTCRPWA